MARKRKCKSRERLSPREIELVRMANDNILFVNSHNNHAGAIREIFAGADIVQGIYRDARSPTGLSFCLLKGRPLIEAAMTANETLRARVTAVAANSAAEAIAMRNVFGDGES